MVRVGGSFAYLAGDGILTFGDHVRTVGDLRAAIEKTTKIPGIKQVCAMFAAASAVAAASVAAAALTENQTSSKVPKSRVLQFG